MPAGIQSLSSAGECRKAVHSGNLEAAWYVYAVLGLKHWPWLYASCSCPNSKRVIDKDSVKPAYDFSDLSSLHHAASTTDILSGIDLMMGGHDTECLRFNCERSEHTC